MNSPQRINGVQHSEGHGFSRAEEADGITPRGHSFEQEHDAHSRAPKSASGWLAFARNRALQMILLFTVALVTIGAGDTTAKFSSIGHKMICVCGCGQILLECNHVGCPDSDRMIGELRMQVAGGGGDTSIFNWFVAKYGPTVLAAPIRGGFDNAAWIVPVVVFVLAIAVTAWLINRWKGRHMLLAANGAPVSYTPPDAMRDRIRRDTEF